MGNPVKTFLKATAAMGMSFWLAACATTDKVPANDKGAAPDPNAEYHNPNAPFSPPFTPTKREKSGTVQDTIPSQPEESEEDNTHRLDM